MRKTAISRRSHRAVWLTAYGLLAPLTCAYGLWLTAALGAVKQEVYVTGTVDSFGGYTFNSSPVQFTVESPGQKEIGSITVDGLYNGEYPWVMRVYTDNLHYAGVGGAIQRGSPAGLISEEGQSAIPIEILSPTFDPGAWRRVPDLNEPGYRPYHPSPEPGEPTYTDCVVMGIDPRNAAWVAGPDRILFTDDDDAIGNWTVETPFELALRADVPPTAAKGRYEAFLYIEIQPAP